MFLIGEEHTRHWPILHPPSCHVLVIDWPVFLVSRQVFDSLV